MQQNDQKRSRLSWRTAVIAVLLAAAAGVGIAALLHANRPGASMDLPVVSCGERTLNSRDFAYYYWTEYYLLLESGYAPATDVPLEEQRYDGERTWQDYMLEQTMQTVGETMALVSAADQAGFTLPEKTQKNLDAVAAKLDENAANAGFIQKNGEADVDAFLADSYGYGATKKAFLAYLQDAYLAAAYADTLFYGEDFSDAEVSAYYDSFAADYAAAGVDKTDTYTVSIRDLIFVPDSTEEADWQAAQDKAEALLEQWEENGGTTEAFAALTTEDAMDTTYSSLRPGVLSDKVDAWCFEEVRQPGDTVIFRSADGVHLICYYAGAEKPIWYEQALSDLRYEAYASTLRNLMDQTPCKLDETRLELHTPQSLLAEAELGDATK